MKLSTEDAKLFYDLLWSLQFYVDHQLKIVGTAGSAEEYAQYSQEQKFAVREALFSHPELIPAYIAKNPDNLSQEKLDIVHEWQYFVVGSFYIERYLKNHAIFIGEQVYAILGLVEEIEDIFPKPYLPVYVRAVLLPFKNCIVYDGLLQSYNVTFGSGIRSSVKEEYLKAKQQGKIIYTLGKKAAQPPMLKTLATQTNTAVWQTELQELAKIASKLKGGAGQPSINSSLFSLIKASIELADTATHSPQDSKAIYQAIKKANKVLNQVKNAYNRMDDD